jgi:hypothetical protein
LDEASAKRYARKSAFLEWCEKDGLSVIGGYDVEDLKSAPLKHWERRGGRPPIATWKVPRDSST